MRRNASSRISRQSRLNRSHCRPDSPFRSTSGRSTRRRPRHVAFVDLFTNRMAAVAGRQLVPCVFGAPFAAEFLSLRNCAHALRMCTFHLHVHSSRCPVGCLCSTSDQRFSILWKRSAEKIQAIPEGTGCSASYLGVARAPPAEKTTSVMLPWWDDGEQPRWKRQVTTSTLQWSCHDLPGPHPRSSPGRPG
jgi:hypothetical protein